VDALLFSAASSAATVKQRMVHKRLRLPDEMKLLCDQHKSSAASARTTSNYCASGVALCDPGLIWQGPMTKWNSEERLYFKYWRRDCHCYSLRVVDYWSLKQPFKVAENLSQLEFRHPASKVHSPSASVQKCLAWADVLPDAESCVSDLLAAWGFAPESCLEGLACVPAVYPLGALLESGAWRTLMLTSQSHVKRQICKSATHVIHPFQICWPPAAWLSASRQRQPLQQPVTLSQPLVEHWMFVVSSFAASGKCDANDFDAMELEGVVAEMDCVARSFDQDASVKFESAVGFRNLRYATTYILDVIRCAVLLKDRSRLADFLVWHCAPSCPMVHFKTNSGLRYMSHVRNQRQF
jgi:hypothetical protein